MRVVAYTELVIFLRVLLGAVTFQNSLLAPIAFAHFVRQRYFQSAFTREAVTGTTRRVEAFVHRESTPPMVVQVFEKGQLLVQRWAGVALTPNPLRLRLRLVPGDRLRHGLGLTEHSAGKRRA